jgi:acetylornithine deacetylase
MAFEREPVPVAGATRDEIAAAVAAHRSETEQLLIELVQAPTLLGEEMAGQELMRATLQRLGLRTRMQRLDAAAIAEHPGASPFSWDVSAKANVIADWGPAAVAHPSGRSLILNGHIDVVSPEPSDTSSRPDRRTCGHRRRSAPGATATGSTAAAPVT